MSFRAALIDFDGTLADSMPCWLSLPQDTLRREGIPEPPGFQRMIREIPMWEVALRLQRDFPALADGHATAGWMDEMREHYLRDVSLKPGAETALDLFRAMGIRTVILSATPADLLDAALTRFSLYGRLDAVFSEHEVGSKREADTYRRCAERLGLPVEDLLLVEDAPRNLAAAARLGLGTVGVFDASMEAEQDSVRAASGVYLPSFLDLAPLREYLERSR